MQSFYSGLQCATFHPKNTVQQQQRITRGKLVFCKFKDSQDYCFRGSVNYLCKYCEQESENGLVNIQKNVTVIPNHLLVSDTNLTIRLEDFLFDDSFTDLESVEEVQEDVVEYKSVTVSLFIDAKQFMFNLLDNQEAILRALKGLLTLFVVTEGALVDFKQLRRRNYGLVKALVTQVEGDSTVGYVGSKTKVILGQTLSWIGGGKKLTKLEGNTNVSRSLIDLITFQTEQKIQWHRLKFLLIGPSGTGKATMIYNLAIELNCFLLEVVNSNVINSLPGDTEVNLRTIFEKAKKMVKLFPGQKVIIFIRDIETFCPKEVESNNLAHMRRVSCYLMNLLESTTNENIIILATTSNIEGVTLRLRRPGRINDEFLIKLPDWVDRREILYSLLKKSSVLQEIVHTNAGLLSLNFMDLCPKRPKEGFLWNVAQKWGARTNGYVAADLHLLVRHFERSISDLVQVGGEGFNIYNVNRIIDDVLKKVPPSIGKGEFNIFRELKVSFASLGGIDKLKKIINISVLCPLTHPEPFQRFDLPPVKGILLYGPPGCAKTTIAQCIARATEMTFLSTSAAEVYSPYVGKAEQYLVKMFNLARAMAPAIIFLDEIDALVGSRTGHANDVQTRILSTLLTEMDGLGGSNQSAATSSAKTILVIAATNRPDMIDNALMRPGRFDKLIHVPAPNEDGRLAILQVQKWRKPFVRDIDLNEIAARTNNFSGADLVNLCNEAALAAATENLDAREITMSHFNRALEQVRPSLTTDQIKNYVIFESDHRGG